MDAHQTRAAQVCAPLHWRLTPDEGRALEDRIAEAIREAVATEKNECGDVAVAVARRHAANMRRDGDGYENDGRGANRAALEIADKIRARGSR